MPANKLWGDFIRLQDRTGPAKQQYDGVFKNDVFARWECPYCSHIVEAREVDAVNKKSHVCKDHFWGKNPCEKRPPDDIRGKPKTSSTTSTSMEAILREQLEQTKEQMKQASAHHAASMEQAEKQHAETMAMQATQLAKQHAEAMDALRKNEKQLASIRDIQRIAICTALELSEHSSDDDDGAKVAARSKRKLDAMQTAATLDAFEKVAKAGSFSPPRDDEPPVVVGKRVVDCVAAVAADASKVAGLNCQIASVNREVGLLCGAPPAERVDAIRALKSEVSKTRKNATDHFDNVARAAGRSHISQEDQVEHISSISKAAAVSSLKTAASPISNSVEAKRNREHLCRLDDILGLKKSIVKTYVGREAAVERLAGSTIPINFTQKITKKLRVALSEDHLQDCLDVASAKRARERLGL